MAYTSPTQIERQRALSQQLRGQDFNRASPLSGLAHVLRQYGAGVGEYRANEAESSNAGAQTKDLQQLVDVLRTGGMSSRQVTGLQGDNLGQIPAKKVSFETPEVGNMYVQALMGQEMKKQDNLLSPEEFQQKIQLAQATENPNEYGLSPNLYQKDGKWYERVYNKGGNYTDRELPGEPVRSMPFNAGLQGDIAGTKEQGTSDVQLEMKPQIEQATAEATVLGKSQGEKIVELGEREAQMPRLMEVADRLSQLGQIATYTDAGQIRDTAKRQLGMDVGDVGVARAEYIAMIDNEVLPLLRQTFGTAFTQREGESLKETLGDPNKSPTEKDAVLRAFIGNKQAEITSLQKQTGQDSNVIDWDELQ